MDNKLPDKFDLIVIGTGMIESILSAAASRIGKKVLHVDRNNYYGGQWASFSLEALQNIQNNQHSNLNSLVETENKNFGNNTFNIENFLFNWHIPESLQKTDNSETSGQKKLEEGNEIQQSDEEKAVKEEWSQNKLKTLSRKFNIDLVPKLQYARGELVELLISSNIARYSEYRSVSRVLVWLNDHLEIVPCSRSDVFSNDRVSVIEKRMLMKLLTTLDEEAEEVTRYEKKTFKEFLKDKKLTPNLIHYVLYAIAMSSDETPFKEGIKNTKRFLNSLGRFGKTPFLFSMYGSGDITQAFCRLSAVFGGIYALNQKIESLTIEEDLCKSLIVNDETISADHFIMSMEYIPKKFIPTGFKKEFISRGVFITDKSVMSNDSEHLTLLLYPPENGKPGITMIELGKLTGTCPENLYVVHLICKQKDTPEADFKHIIDNLFCISSEENQEMKPNILCSCYFSLPDTNGLVMQDLPKNVFLCPGPDLDLDYDFSIDKAKEIFAAIYPDSEFLPRAPDPEEIVIEGEDQ